MSTEQLSSDWLSGAADLNGDGFEDVLVGAPNGSGRAELLSGGTGELIKAWTGSDRAAQLGSAVAGSGSSWKVLVGSGRFRQVLGGIGMC